MNTTTTAVGTTNLPQKGSSAGDIGGMLGGLLGPLVGPAMKALSDLDTRLTRMETKLADIRAAVARLEAASE